MKKKITIAHVELWSIFWVSACMISLEICLTRVFSAVLRYHFVFLVISIAVCGLGLGGMVQALSERVKKLPIVVFSSGIGVATIAFMALFLKVILPVRPEALWLIALLTLVPYVFGGAFYASIFSRNSADAGFFYAADLTGAGLASLLIVAVLQVFGAVNAVLLIAALVTVPGVFQNRKRAGYVAVLITGVVILGSNLCWNWLDVPPMPTRNTGYAKMLFAEMAVKPGIQILHTEWDAFARTDVVKDPEMGDDLLLVYTNGHVPTRLIRYDEKKGRFALTENIAEIPLAWRPGKRVLCIGPGGGMDVLIAQKYGAESIDGVEINPAIANIVEIPEFKRYYGDLYNKDNVRLFIADGRTYVERTPEHYDLIFLSLTKTATGISGIALVEGYIYTVEAIQNYLAKLTENGMIVFVTDGYIANVRLFVTALRAFEREGKTLNQAMAHVALISVPDSQRGRNPYEFALIISLRPLTKEEGESLLELSVKKGYRPLFIPGIATVPTFRRLMERDASIESFCQGFYQNWKKQQLAMNRSLAEGDLPVLNILPATDDQPFFLDFSFGVPDMLKPLFYMTFFSLAAIFVLMMLKLKKGGERELAAMGYAYFACLGIAFMLVEIPMIQKLILILGHPVYALCVVLFALLSGCGLGSYVSQRTPLKEKPFFNAAICIAAGVVCVGVALYLNTPKQLELSLPLLGRIIWAAGISGVLGFFLGMPFPVGIRQLGKRNPGLIPWMWGVNGISSVVGSVLAAVGAKFVGFQMIFFCGAAMYLIAMLVSSYRWPEQEGQISSGPTAS